MSNLLKNFKCFINLIGKKTALIFFFSVVLGLLLFAVELGFSYFLQGFLSELGILSKSDLSIPSWLPVTSFFSVTLGLFFLILLRGVCVGLQNYLRGCAEDEFRLQQRLRLVDWAFSSDSVSGSRLVRLFTESTASSGTVLMAIQILLVNGIFILALLALLFYTSPTLTSLMLLASTLLAIPSWWLDNRIRIFGKKIAQQWTATTGKLLIVIKNLILIQIHGTQNQEASVTKNYLQEYHRNVMNFHIVSSIKIAIPQIGGVFIACIVAVYAKRNLNLSPGNLLLYFYFILRIIQSFSQTSFAWARILIFWPQLRELSHWRDEFSSSPELSLDVFTEPVSKSLRPVSWKVDKISFKYPSNPKPVLENLDLSIKPSSTTVIVGESGSGKSTLISLLLGILKPTNGRILVGLDSDASLTLDSCKARLLSQIGYVGPESYLIEGTVRENLIYGLKYPPSQKEIEEALEKAECGFIGEFPLGLDHWLTEQGQGLSAGQKQRLSLARALLRNPKALILDEATSNLDEQTENRLMDSLVKLKQSVTMLVITHRPTLLKMADQVIHLTKVS